MEYKIVREYAAPKFCDYNTDEVLYYEAKAEEQALWVVKYDPEQEEIVEWLERFYPEEVEEIQARVDELNREGE